MKYKVIFAAAVLGLTAQMAQAMPVRSLEAEATVTLVSDGCGRGFHLGRDGECHRDRYEEPRRPYVRERYYEEPRYERRERLVCPRGYHLGRMSGVCRPN